jgi:putative transposase
MAQSYFKARHSTTKLVAHFVFTTRYRRKLLSEKVRGDLAVIFSDICDYRDCELIEFNGEEDHVHLLVQYPPQLSISDLVNVFKAISSRRIRKSHAELTKQANKGVLWSRAYFACSAGGATIDVLKEYIENQGA